MALNETEIINYIKDVEYDYNMKLILLSLISIYLIVGLAHLRKKEIKYYYQFIIKRVVQSISFVWFIFLPLYVTMLYRTISYESMLLTMLGVYGLLIALFPLFTLFFGGEWLSRRLLAFIGKDREWEVER